MSIEHQEEKSHDSKIPQTSLHLGDTISSMLTIVCSFFVFMISVALFGFFPSLVMAVLFYFIFRNPIGKPKTSNVVDGTSEIENSLAMSNEVPDHETGEGAKETSSGGFFAWSLLNWVPVVLVLGFFGFVFLSVIVGDT
jgi:hypothetical protein